MLGIGGNGYLEYYINNNWYGTSSKVILNDWNFIGVKIINNAAYIYLNNSLATISASNSSIANISRISIGSYLSSTTTQDWLNSNQGSNLAMTVDFLYVSIGEEDFTSDQLKKVYNDGIKYFYNYKINQSSSVMYYNSSVYQNLNVITLNGSLASSSGLQPKEYCYTDNNFTIDKTRIFEYDETLKRHVYGSYEDYVNFNSKRKSLLSYKLPLSTTGTLIVWFKPSSSFQGDKRYILNMKTSTTDISVYMDTNYQIHKKSGSYDYNTGKYAFIDQWNMVAVKWEPESLCIKVNDSPFSQSAINGINMFDSTLYIGCMFLDSTKVPVNHLNGNLEMFSYTSNYLSINETNNIYNNGRIINVRNTYDDDGRIKEKDININNTSLKTLYRYYEENNKQNPILTSEVSYDEEEIIYSYDELGNITHKLILDGNSVFKEGYNYEYDELKRLKKETRFNENNILDYCYKYNYDSNSNIETRIRVNELGEELYKDTYHYSSEIKDRLDLVQREESDETYVIRGMTYANDNKLFPSIYTINSVSHNLVWEGKRLKRFGASSYEYDENGIRISNKVGEYGFTYNIEGSRIVRSKNETGVGTTIIDYHYDEKGLLCGFNYSGEEYFYIRDITGNINKIVDKEGRVMVKYSYTAFGIPSKAVGSDLAGEKLAIANIIKDNNIYIYKGYCYDSGTNLYYLNSRYYDPTIGRFISPDDISYLAPWSIGGLNLYAYCLCNPIMYFDPEGNGVTLIIILICIAIGATIGGVAAYNIAKKKGATGWALFGWTMLGFVGGGIIGGCIGYLIAPVIVPFLTASASITIPTGLGFWVTSTGTTTLVVTSTTTLTITGAQALTVIGALIAGLTIMFSKNANRYKPKDTRNNQVQNREFREVVKEFQRKFGELTEDQIRNFHESIAKKGIKGFHKLLEALKKWMNI